MQLYATPLSHFSRKVRILLDLYGLDYRSIDIGNVANADAAQFRGNPLMKVPVLNDNELWLVESDHIAAYLARTYDAADRYQVLTTDASMLNKRAILNGIMTDEVKIILAERTGLDTRPHAFFHKARASIENGLQWLDARGNEFNPRQPSYLDFHLVCLWEHLQYYGLIELPYPALEAIVREVGSQDPIGRSAPHVLSGRFAVDS